MEDILLHKVFCRRKCYNISIFLIRGIFFATSYFSCKREPGVVKIVSHIPKSLFYRKSVNILSSDLRQVILGIHFLVITNYKLIEKLYVYQYFSKSEY